jgi:transposase
LDRQFTAAAPNQRWVGDTTEFVIGECGKLYLATILDLFSRFVVGWAVSAVNDRHLTLKALGMAIKRRCPDTGLLHHSDQGCTYASEDYQRMLDAHGITCSMSRRGNCHDHAVAESFFSTLKSELGEHFDSHDHAKMELFDYIEVFYNQRRRHSTLGQISPATFECRAIEEGMDPMQNRPERGFAQAPHPSTPSLTEEQTTKSDQHSETVHRIGSGPEVPRMKLHRHAKSTPSSRLLLVRRVLFEGWSYPAAARAAGVSERTVAKWVHRFRQKGIEGLQDGSSRPGVPSHQTPAWAVTLMQWLREQHGLPAWAIGQALQVPRSTVTAWLRRRGLNRRPGPPKVPIRGTNGRGPAT